MLKQVIVAGLCMASLAGCVNAPYLGTDDMARVVEQDASNLNRAHARATNALILQNILRARDRWPTHYTTLGGVKVDPKTTVTAKLALAPLGLGSPARPLGESNASIDQSSVAMASYSINPFSDNAKSIFQPVTKLTLSHYWNNAWPKDVLVRLLISSIKIKNDDGDEIWISNGGEDSDSFINAMFEITGGAKSDPVKDATPEQFKNQIKDWRMEQKKGVLKPMKKCVPKVGAIAVSKPENCPVIFCGSVSDLIEDHRTNDLHKTSILSQIESLKKLSGDKIHIEYDDTKNYSIKACAAPSKGNSWHFVGKNSEPIEGILDFKLRSFDDMIYYVGETLRSKSVKVKTPCNDAGLIFKVYDQKARENVKTDKFAAKVKHAGKTYFAAPRFAFEEEAPRECHKERTTTVLSILTQLFLLNQSAEFLKAPDDAFIQR